MSEDWPKPVDGLPPYPLRDRDLLGLAQNDAVETVWVTTHRAESVYTLTGEHDGDILEFYLETESGYARYTYEPRSNTLGLCWHRYQKTPKESGDEFDTSAKEIIEETLSSDEYEPLRARLSRNDSVGGEEP